MPHHLRAASLLYIASLLSAAALAPFYETGVWRVIAPMLALSFAFVAVQFMRRRQWSWLTMKWVAVAGVTINLAFFPTIEFYGEYVVPASAIAVAEVLACAVILWSILRHRPSRSWFAPNEA